MFGIGGFELFIILIFAFLIFGPEKLPEIGKTVGRAIAKFREAQQDMNETLGSDKIFDPNNPDEPFKDPIEALDKLAKRQEEKAREKEKAASAAKGGNVQPEAESAATGDGETPRQESFTERKARYERDRAARKAAEAKAAEPAAP
ncbi:MAG: twin-arginine translocase TatA/TatE family subunit, partial [Eggerthellaceae bacterium]|nr:twin-arginine translocase TatA/TatE family subunit [Eggerthellaceae bacterium]